MCHWEPHAPEELLFTDASDFGFGAHTSAVPPKDLVSGLWQSEDASRHISFKELKVV